MLVGVVAAIVVFALFAGGVIPLTHSSSGSSDVTYARASSLAESATNAVAGGPWTPIEAVGIDSTSGFTLVLENLSQANCSLALVGSASPVLHIPSDRAFSSGASPWWSLVYVNRSAPRILLVDVVNGSAQPLAVGTGLCASTLAGFGALPSHAVDSPGPASELWNVGGSYFASVHSNLPLNLLMGLTGGGAITNGTGTTLKFGATWLLVFSPCGSPYGGGPSGKQPVYLAPFNATTDLLEGAPLFPYSTTSTCANLTSLSSSGFSLIQGRGGSLSTPPLPFSSAASCLPPTGRSVIL